MLGGSTNTHTPYIPIPTNNHLPPWGRGRKWLTFQVNSLLGSSGPKRGPGKRA